MFKQANTKGEDKLKTRSKKGVIIAAIVVVLIVGAATLIYTNTFTYKANRILRHIDQYTAVYTEYKSDLLEVMGAFDLDEANYSIYGDTLEKNLKQSGDQVKTPFAETTELGENEKEIMKGILNRYYLSLSFSQNWIAIRFSVYAKPYDPWPFIIYSPQGTPGLHHRKGAVIDLGDGWYFVVDASMMFF